MFRKKELPRQDPLVRKEIRDMTMEEWQIYKSAFIKVAKHGFLEDLAEIHKKYETFAHNTPRFLPWHRAFLLHFENILQVVSNNQRLTVPYWDWTIDCEDPDKSFIFKEDYWGIQECFEVMFPTKHCLKRNENSIDPFYSKLQMNMLINRKMSYDKFRESFELVPHAIVHFNVGGRDGDMSHMFSTNDPIFWHHHSYVDYVWHQKQMRNLGMNYVNKKELDEWLEPFMFRVKDVMDLKNCGRVYKEYVETKIMEMSGNKKAGKIGEEYAKRHNYELKKVREIEEYLETGKMKMGAMRRFLRFLLRLFY